MTEQKYGIGQENHGPVPHLLTPPHISHRGPGLWANSCVLCNAVDAERLSQECPMIVVNRSEWESLEALGSQVNDWYESFRESDCD